LIDSSILPETCAAGVTCTKPMLSNPSIHKAREPSVKGKGGILSEDHSPDTISESHMEKVVENIHIS
jgi:hypothetical protein